MRIGQTVLAKVNGKIVECKVLKLEREDVHLLYNEEKIIRKYWRIRKLPK